MATTQTVKYIATINMFKCYEGLKVEVEEKLYTECISERGTR
jgi:hypothetical protein